MRPDFKTYSDTELVRVLTGLSLPDSQQAYRVIVERYSGQMLDTCYSVLQDKVLGKDCVQNVLLRIWQNRLNYKIANLPAYLHHAVRMECLQALRNIENTESLDERFESIESRLQANDPLRYKELRSLLDKVLATLPEDQRRIFLMSREQEMTYKEIAGELGISIKTVEKKMTNSLRFIKTHLNTSDNLATAVLFCLTAQ
jgi:RNA polymerase sigma-70 factor (family 1)